MANDDDFLALPDAALLGQCDLHTYKSSGPGGQHRNKVSSAVRLKHRPTGISAHGDESRRQSENKNVALCRLRMNLALQIRRPVDISSPRVPPLLAECIFTPRGGQTPAGIHRIQFGRKDSRFWPVAALLLDILDAFQGKLADAAAYLGITGSNLTSVLESDRHLLAAAQALRKHYNLKQLM